MLRRCGGGSPRVALGTRRRGGQAQPGRYNRVGPRPGLGRRLARSRIAAGAGRHWAAGESEPAGHQPSQPRPSPELPPPPNRCPPGRAGRDAPRDPYLGRRPPPPSPLRPPRYPPPAVTPQPWRAARVRSRVPAHPQLWQPGPRQSQDLLQKVILPPHHRHHRCQPWCPTLPQTPPLP